MFASTLTNGQLDAGGSDNDLVGWVTVKCAGKLCGRDGNFRRKRQWLDAGVCESFHQPLINRHKEWQRAKLDQFSCFPA